MSHFKARGLDGETKKSSRAVEAVVVDPDDGDGTARLRFVKSGKRQKIPPHWVVDLPADADGLGFERAPNRTARGRLALALLRSEWQVLRSFRVDLLTTARTILETTRYTQSLSKTDQDEHETRKILEKLYDELQAREEDADEDGISPWMTFDDQPAEEIVPGSTIPHLRSPGGKPEPAW